MNHLDPPAEVAPLFELVGWRAGRQCAAPPLPETAHPAGQILASFTGLVVRPEREAGVECAPSVIRFGEVEARDPLIAEWAALLEVDLVPVGECDFGHDALLVATDGRCFGVSYIHEAFYFHGSTFWEAVTRLLKGQRAKPMLLPRLCTVTLYGKVFTQDSPDLYAHNSCDRR